MLARRLLVLLLQLPLVLLLPQETEEVVDTPVAAALVSLKMALASPAMTKNAVAAVAEKAEEQSESV